LNGPNKNKTENKDKNLLKTINPRINQFDFAFPFLPLSLAFEAPFHFFLLLLFSISRAAHEAETRIKEPIPEMKSLGWTGCVITGSV